MPARRSAPIRDHLTQPVNAVSVEESNVVKRVPARSEQGIASVGHSRFHLRHACRQEAWIPVALAHLGRQLHEADEVGPTGEAALIDLQRLQAGEIGGGERCVGTMDRVDRREFLALRTRDRRGGVLQQARQCRVHPATVSVAVHHEVDVGRRRVQMEQQGASQAEGGRRSAGGLDQQLRERERVLLEWIGGPAREKSLQPLSRVVDAHHLEPWYGVHRHAQGWVLDPIGDVHRAQRRLLVGDAVDPAVAVLSAHALSARIRYVPQVGDNSGREGARPLSP